MKIIIFKFLDPSIVSSEREFKSVGGDFQHISDKLSKLEIWNNCNVLDE